LALVFRIRKLGSQSDTVESWGYPALSQSVPPFLGHPSGRIYHRRRLGAGTAILGYPGLFLLPLNGLIVSQLEKEQGWINPLFLAII
jgi:hypothetical protein